MTEHTDFRVIIEQRGADGTSETKQADAAVQATMGLAKLHGLLVDRHEDISRSYDNMTKAEIEAEIARLTRAKLERQLAEAKAQPGRPTLKLVRT